jgi:hydroxymethylpyrimidine pyrophosphatase-like HAD family hydrolase
MSRAEPYFTALATDYDGTIAHDSTVDPGTIDALRRLKASGRKLLLVTGRELPELKEVFPELPLFDLVVAENGALLHTPATGAARPLAEPPPAAFIERLRLAGVHPLGFGEVIVATREPHETAVLEAIRDLGLELQIIFNKGAVMVLPAGVNKATGLAVALAELGIEPERVVACGDAENDHAFLDACGCAVAVANALPSVKAKADIVTIEKRGPGVTEVIELILDGDAAALSAAIARQAAEGRAGAPSRLARARALG